MSVVGLALLQIPFWLVVSDVLDIVVYFWALMLGGVLVLMGRKDRADLPSKSGMTAIGDLENAHR